MAYTTKMDLSNPDNLPLGKLPYEVVKAMKKAIKAGGIKQVFIDSCWFNASETWRLHAVYRVKPELPVLVIEGPDGCGYFDAYQWNKVKVRLTLPADEEGDPIIGSYTNADTGHVVTVEAL